MNDGILNPRILENTDWATLLFVVCIALVAVVRSVFVVRFSEFTRLAVSDKYIKVYRDPSQTMSWFNAALFAVHLVTLSFFLQLVLSHFGYAKKDDWVLYIRIFTLTGVFILSKYLIEKIIAASFGIDEFAEQFNLQKISYRTYFGLLLLPVDILLFYADSLSNIIVYALIIALLAANAFTYVVSVRNYQNLLTSKLFYFILYLCALEIAPYYFIYYWFTKS